MRATVAAVALASAVIVASCGGSSRAQPTTTVSTSPAPTAAPTTAGPPGPTTSVTRTPTTPPKSEADQAIATRVSLQPSDIPAGWTTRPFTTSADTQASTKAFQACIGLSLDPTRTADVNSDDYTNESGSVSSDIRLVATRAIASADFAALDGGKLSSCSHDYLSNGLTQAGSAAGISIESVTVDPIAPSPVGDVTVGVRATIVTSSSNADLTIYVDLVSFGTGRIEGDLSFLGAGAPFDPTLEASILKAVGSRAVAEAVHT
jgi:hypothetical protein